MILSVGGTITGAVGFELQQFLLPLTFLQLHYADLQTHTRGSHYTRKRHDNNSKLSSRTGNEVYRGIQEKQNKYILEYTISCVPAAPSSVFVFQRFVCVVLVSPSTNSPDTKCPSLTSAPHIETSAAKQTLHIHMCCLTYIIT